MRILDLTGYVLAEGKKHSAATPNYSKFNVGLEKKSGM